MKHHRLIALLWVALLVSTGLAAPPSLNIPVEVRPTGQYVEFMPETDAVSVTYIGLSGVDALPTRLLADRRLFLLDVRGLPNGQYKFSAVASSKEGDQIRKDFVVPVGGGPTPGPTPPTPPPSPGPTPGPTPPGPTPPVPGGGRMVLITFDAAKAREMPESQQAVIYGEEVRKYLRDKCDPEEGRTTKAWRIYPSNTDVSEEASRWKTSMARPRNSLPWILVSNGTSWYEGPLPKTVEEAMTLLKKYLE